MAEPTKGWAWFERPSGETQDADASAAGLPDAGRDAALAFARCFAGPDGERVLAHLKSLTLERAFGPDVPAALLRHTEGQRQLVRYIVQQVERGRTGA